MTLGSLIMVAVAALLMVFGVVFVVKALTEQEARREAGVPLIVDVTQFFLAFFLKFAGLTIIVL